MVLDFAGIGVTEYDGISTTLASVSVEGARQDDVFVIRQFCDRMSKLLQSIKGKTGYDIAKASNETFM